MLTMGLSISTFGFSRSSFSKEEQAKLRLLLRGVWRMDEDEDPVAYADHFTELLSDLVDRQHLHQPTAEQTISLVQSVKTRALRRSEVSKTKSVPAIPLGSWMSSLKNRYLERLISQSGFPSLRARHWAMMLLP